MWLLRVVCVVLTAMAMGLSLAHALELPGKMRLDERTYRAVQRIYYPGFTIGGAIGEFGGLIATLVLLLITPRSTPDFALTLAALACLVGMQTIYWTVTHPANREWMAGERLGRSGAEFFGGGGEPNVGWTTQRRRWERSHAARSVLGFAAFLCLLLAASVGE